MPRVIWSASSLSDLAVIDEYLTRHDPRAAARILKSVRDRTSLLARYPESGPATSGVQRQLAVRGSPYVIIYALNGPQVQILRIRHHAEDWRPTDQAEP